MHLARRILVSMLVLGSFGTLADATYAENGGAQVTPLDEGDKAEVIPFECHVPLVGSERCGSPNRNVRVRPHRTVHAVMNSSSSGQCVNFKVYHAINNKELSLPIEVCPNRPATLLWFNDNDEPFDVYMMVSAAKGSGYFEIKGNYLATL